MKQKRDDSFLVSSSETEVETFGSRLYKILNGEPARTFALKANLTPAAFHKYLKCQSEPTRPVMNAIAEAASVNLEWLATGRGPMRKSDCLPVATEPQSFSITNLEGRQIQFKPSPELCHLPILDLYASCGLVHL